MDESRKNLPHQPVLYHEVINILQPEAAGRYVDGTAGAGGHSLGIVEESAPDGKLIALDIDEQAIQIARKNLASFSDRVKVLKGSYVEMDRFIQNQGWKCADGILLDLGISSMQLDTAERGFSFLKKAPLDMRFDQSSQYDAQQLVNHLDEKELERIIREYGEERYARKIARTIVKNRPFQTTIELAETIKNASGEKHQRIHPATRTFQALRIAVNKELERIEEGLEKAVSILCSGGRIGVISYHSLEDRIVKQFFNRESRDCICPPEQPVCTCGHKAVLEIITKRPITPSKEEIEQNPRSRSAKLRAAKKI